MESPDQSSRFRATLEHWSKFHPYEFAQDVRESRYVEGDSGGLADLLTLLSAHNEYAVEDLIALDGRDFVASATAALRGRLPGPAQYQIAASDLHMWQKLDLLIELDAANRKDGRRIRTNIRLVDRLLWHLHRRLTGLGLATAGRLAFAFFRWRARRLGTRLAPDTSLRRMLLRSLRQPQGKPSPAPSRRRVVIANLYPVWPVMHGGQRRIFFLARELSRTFDVEIVTPQIRGRDRIITFNPHLREIRIKTDPGYDRQLDAIEQTVEMASDAAYTLHWAKCRNYQAALAARLAGADLCVSSHPYSIHALLDARCAQPIPLIYDAHNVEVRLKAPLLEQHPALLDAVRAVETTAVDEADLIVCCSPDDIQGLRDDYDVERVPLHLVANGVDARGVPTLTAEARRRIRHALHDTRTGRLAIFAGSYHYPNFEAADRILALAARMPEITFLFVGSVCGYQALKRSHAVNVIRLGEVDESTKWLAFQVSDIALNPIESGSGSNIKTFEYAAGGLAVLSTRFGARGVPPELRDQFILCEPAEFGRRLAELALRDDETLRRIGAATRAAALACADWAVIGQRYREHVSALLDRYDAPVISVA